MSCDLSVEIAGLHFKNPILAASGTFGYGLEFAPWFDLGRLGGICTKGLSLEPLEGNPPPRIVETHGGMLNAIGLQNIGVRAFVTEKLPLLRQFQTHIIANVFGSCFEEYLDVIRILEDAEGIAAYELNVSCPNVKAGGMEFGNDPDEAARLTEACKRIARRPIIVKLSPNAGDIVRVARAVEKAGADALSAINTILGLSVDVYTRRPRLATGMGGLSGPALKRSPCAWSIRSPAPSASPSSASAGSRPSKTPWSSSSLARRPCKSGRRTITTRSSRSRSSKAFNSSASSREFRRFARSSARSRWTSALLDTLGTDA